MSFVSLVSAGVSYEKRSLRVVSSGTTFWRVQEVMCEILTLRTWDRVGERPSFVFNTDDRRLLPAHLDKEQVRPLFEAIRWLRQLRARRAADSGGEIRNLSLWANSV